MFGVLLRQPVVTEPHPLASGNSQIQLYSSTCVCESVCVKESDKCGPRGRQEEEEEEGSSSDRAALLLPLLKPS